MPLTEEQRADRRTRIGSGDIAAVAGLSPWSSPHEVWLEKMGLADSKESEASLHGEVFEPAIARIYESKRGVKLVKNDCTIRSTKGRHLTATPDYFIDDETRCIVECKMVGFRSAFSWGAEHEDPRDAIPVNYYAQLTWQMHITGDQVADLIACFGTSSRIWSVRYDKEFGDLLEVHARWFWRLVQSRTPPPVDGTEGAKELLRKLYPRSQSVQRDATEREAALVEELRSARARLDLAEVEKRRAENLIKESMQTTERIVGDGWRVRWKASKSGQRPFNFEEEKSKESAA